MELRTFKRCYMGATQVQADIEDMHPKRDSLTSKPIMYRLNLHHQH